MHSRQDRKKTQCIGTCLVGLVSTKAVQSVDPQEEDDVRLHRVLAVDDSASDHLHAGGGEGGTLRYRLGEGRCYGRLVVKKTSLNYRVRVMWLRICLLLARPLSVGVSFHGAQSRQSV
jgi:hypothetical protein